MWRVSLPVREQPSGGPLPDVQLLRVHCQGADPKPMCDATACVLQKLWLALPRNARRALSALQCGYVYNERKCLSCCLLANYAETNVFNIVRVCRVWFKVQGSSTNSRQGHKSRCYLDLRCSFRSYAASHACAAVGMASTSESKQPAGHQASSNQVDEF